MLCLLCNLSCCVGLFLCVPFFFFNDTATTEIYTLSLHDALPISVAEEEPVAGRTGRDAKAHELRFALDPEQDRKSTRLNSSHGYISYAVFCLKKKKKDKRLTHTHPTDNTT